MFWITDRRPVVDPNRRDGWGEIISFECDSLSDIPNLPANDGKNQGYTVLVLENSTIHKLGTTGWRQI